MARMTLAEIKARPSTIDWTRVNATTDGDIDRQAKEDGTDVELPGWPLRHRRPYDVI